MLTSNSTTINSTAYNWYTWNFQGSTVPPSNYTQNADGTISLQDNTTAVAALSSAHSTNNANGFVGVGYGGGMYWEVTATISNSQNNNFAGMAPAALWLVDLEHTSQGPPYTKSWPVTTSTFWPSVPQLQNADGSSGMDDYIEIDMMEYDFTVAGGHPSGFEINMSNWTNHVSGNAINWGPSNKWPQIVGGSSGSTPVPIGTDFGQQHKYGMLWVPATGSGQTTTTQGYLAFFFDGVQIAGGLPTGPTPTRPCYWNYHDPSDVAHYPTSTQAGAPTTQNQGYSGGGSWPTYFDVNMSILDFRHLMLIMNSGGVQGMTIYSSQVWQKSAAQNLVIPPPTAAVFGVKAIVGHLESTVDGLPVELIGMSMSGCETPPAPRCADIAAAGPAFWGGAFKAAHVGTNTVRLPADAVNTNLGVYEKAVNDALSAGLYVIIDLHWTAPTGQASIGQPGFPDADHSIGWWKQIADDFGSNPAVIFELFNEPYADNSYGDATGSVGLNCLANGCSYPTFCQQNNGAGNSMKCYTFTYEVAGEEQMLATIRGEGATNLILASPPWWAGEIEYWLQAYSGLTDTNTCASMHAYSYDKGMGPVNAVLAAGRCIVITEFTSPVGNLGAAGPLQALGIGTISWGPNAWGGSPSMSPTGW